MPAYIVAEAGINHKGRPNLMRKLCQEAKRAGASAIKFQAYDWTKLRDRRGITDESTLAMLRSYQLTDKHLKMIRDTCGSIGLDWFASVFDPAQVERVLSFGACALKIGHAEARWEELVAECHRARHLAGRSALPIYISVDNVHRDHHPTVEGPGGWIHCIDKYPADGHQPRLHLVTGRQRANEYGGPEECVGFSSHYNDYGVPAASALLGAQYIEAHFALDETDPEADWSLLPADFFEMVRMIREYESWR
jgi:N-acetylneuraminate synthase